MNEQVAQSEEAFVRGMEHPPEVVKEQAPVWQEVQVSVTRGLWRTHAMVSGVLDIVSKLAGSARSVSERGPKDYDERSYERGLNAGRKMAPKYSNGDSEGTEKRLRLWHLWIAVAALTVPVLGSAWILSVQMSTAFAVEATLITGLQNHQKEQDERTTRIEQQQLQQLSRERR